MYLIRNYRVTKNGVGFGNGLVTTKQNSNSYVDPDFAKFSRAVEATPFAKAIKKYSYDSNSTAIYALKSMDKELISQFKASETIMNEKEILSMIDHPFIMKMHYSFSTKNYLNLVLDY